MASSDHRHESSKVFYLYSLFPLSFHGKYRQLILDHNKIVDPAGVLARKASKIRRWVFIAAGLHHMWALDQHDKWMRFGLRMHIGIEPFTGVILWLIIWWSNSNPRLIAQQYFKTVKHVGGKDKTPLLFSFVCLIPQCRLANANTE